MFCPEGYHPLAELWDQYRDKRLCDFYEASTQFYASDEFEPHFVRGSPLDICEHTFLKSISQCGICLAAPDGRIMRLHAPLEDGRASLFSVRPVQASALQWAAHEVETDSLPGTQTLEAPLFLPWHEDEKAAWSEAYPPLNEQTAENWPQIAESLRFHCLPLCFERPRFTIVTNLPPWARNIRHADDIQLLADKFGGWSVCMAEAALDVWQPYLEGKGVYEDQFSIKGEIIVGGRPGKRTQALQDFDLTFPRGRNVPWKLVPEQIKTVTGNDYSESTVRRGLKLKDN